VSVVKDYDDGPVSASRGEQTGDPLDEVVAKSFRARSPIVRYIGTAHERWKTTKPAPADAADPIRVPITRMQIKSIDPGTEGGQTLEETTVRDQPDGEFIAVRYQLGRQSGFSHPCVTEHQSHSQPTEHASFLFGPQHSEFLDASGHEKLIAADVAE
jgi:hypothetical protein